MQRRVPNSPRDSFLAQRLQGGSQTTCRGCLCHHRPRGTHRREVRPGPPSSCNCRSEPRLTPAPPLPEGPGPTGHGHGLHRCRGTLRTSQPLDRGPPRGRQPQRPVHRREETVMAEVVTEALRGLDSGGGGRVPSGTHSPTSSSSSWSFGL